MNDEYAIEPTAFRSAADLRYILEKFGFCEGRFVARFPMSWTADVKKSLDQLPDVERKRAVELLEKHKRRCCFADTRLPFDVRKPWSENVRDTPQILARAIYALESPTIDDVDDDFFKPSRESRILAKTTEYARVARRLIQASGEVFLIDPYFKLSRPGYAKSLNEFLKIGASAACRSFHIFSRYDECSEGSDEAYDRIARRQVKLERGQRLHSHLVDDGDHINKMHDRHLLSIKGAICFSKGFAEAPRDQYVVSSYVDRNGHEDLTKLFIDGKHGFTVKHSLILNA